MLITAWLSLLVTNLLMFLKRFFNYTFELLTKNDYVIIALILSFFFVLSSLAPGNCFVLQIYLVPLAVAVHLDNVQGDLSKMFSRAGVGRQILHPKFRCTGSKYEQQQQTRNPTISAPVGKTAFPICLDPDSLLRAA